MGIQIRRKLLLDQKEYQQYHLQGRIQLLLQEQTKLVDLQEGAEQD